MYYNLTSLAENSTGLLPFVQNVNSHLMQHMLGTVFLIGLVIIIFLGFMVSTNDSKRSVAATSVIGFGLAVLLRAINLIPNRALFIALVVAAATLALTWRD